MLLLAPVFAMTYIVISMLVKLLISTIIAHADLAELESANVEMVSLSPEKIAKVQALAVLIVSGLLLLVMTEMDVPAKILATEQDNVLVDTNALHQPTARILLAILTSEFALRIGSLMELLAELNHTTYVTKDASMEHAKLLPLIVEQILHLKIVPHLSAILLLEPAHLSLSPTPTLRALMMMLAPQTIDALLVEYVLEIQLFVHSLLMSLPFAIL